MAFAEAYRSQVALLIRTLPSVAAEECFAMKGGTAINLFIRDLPRLSVDIDLTYLPVQDRATSLAAIDASMLRIAQRIAEVVPGARVAPSRSRENIVTKLVVRSGSAQIKIEVTPVLRGCVFEPEMRPVSPNVEDEFGFAEMRIVSFPDLYAGKIVAALDRQHPRDLFDVRDLLANEGIDEALRRAFLVYLISHDRPMAEVLAVRRKDIAAEFERGFVGMTRQPVDLDQLLAARETLVSEIVGSMPNAHRQFLSAFERGEPDWSTIGSKAAADLPAVRWRQQNLNSLSAEKRGTLVKQLEEALAR
ncbi:Nucleotidyl transferase AbiEii toxin, Type IV TA system [Bosea sp. CRIB-10]|uniref:nucleotidyl transferase AbiEii/AbiGii toxin family protein n=1 Tax=Bosea sp. CRIB-10 TaxID=378404 RepID=UPI0008E6BBD3|nr:nucleotidyl transferase AbiEii/AbiGii toxin family protein [Bosea sp. CRIB-10]SFD71971.1 Nucleotidyl transferase AbiEii toxin, Type IV TA system [Bosea sp. CRIB-10]